MRRIFVIVVVMLASLVVPVGVAPIHDLLKAV
jgi:hypothetical protein